MQIAEPQKTDQIPTDWWLCARQPPCPTDLCQKRASQPRRSDKVHERGVCDVLTGCRSWAGWQRFRQSIVLADTRSEHPITPQRCL